MNLARSKARLTANPASRAKFYKPDGSNYEVGDVYRQPDLAWTLEQIAEGGADAFYRGEIARRIAADMAKHNGLITLEDLAGYRVVEREPVRGTFRGYDIAAMSAPSFGRDAHRPDAEHLRELPAEGDGLRQRGRHARHGRVDAARLRRPQQVPGRPGPPRSPGRRAHQQGLRGGTGEGHLPQPRPAVSGGRPRQPGALREPGDHPLLGPRQRGQRARQHLHADVLLRLGGRDRRHRHPHEQQPRQLHAEARHPRRLRADG